MTNPMLQTHDTHPTAALTTRLLVAMEMSLKTWRLVMAPEGGSRKRVKTVDAGNFVELEQAVADLRERFKLPVQTPVVCCYEAGRDGFYPYRRLTEVGYEVWVIDSASIEVSRRQKQAKSDGIDGDKLAELMQRRARGELKALRIVRVPPPTAEDERLLPREREILLTRPRTLAQPDRIDSVHARLSERAENCPRLAGLGCGAAGIGAAVAGAVLGLTPTPYSSGQEAREQGISKAGNRRARSMLVELAWLWLRYQPNSALTQWFKARFSGGGKRLRRIGIVALARRLAIALWRYVAQGIVPEGATLKSAVTA